MDLSNCPGAIEALKEAIIMSLREVGQIASILARIDTPMRKKIRRLARRKR